MRALTLLLLALAACVAAAADDTPPSPPYAYRRAYVAFDDENASLTLVPAPPAAPGDAPYEPPDDAVAWGEYAPASVSPSGTGTQHVATSGAASDADQMTAAGMVEGYLTAREIADYYQNTWTYFTSPTGLNASLGSADDPSTPLGWLATQDAWARARASSARARRDTRWTVIGLLLAQLDGLVDGYAAAVAESEAAAAEGHAAHPKLPPLSSHQLRFLNANGDLYDVIEHCRRYGGGKVGETQSALPQLLASRPTYTRLATAGRCSAVVAVAPDLSDIFVGHSVWDSFSQATKVFKHVSTALATVGVPLTAQRVSYSSFPGELSSDDDLYLTPRLIIASTSLHIVNPDIYRTLPPTVLLSWQRVRAATLLATNGRDWARLFSADNSGTYNNEFLVLAPSSFAPGTDAPLRPGLLTVVDQIPGLVTTVDATRALDRGFFPSYNLPSNLRVYDKCGLNDDVAVAAVAGRLDAPLAATRWLSYQAAPRASIFRRDGGGIGSVARLRQVMRSVYTGGAGGKGGDTTTKPCAPLDPLAHGDALAAVCGRADLEADAATREPRGCFDSKATSVRLARELVADVVTGPSTAGGLLPPFKPADWAHVMPTAGMPEVWDF